MVRVIVEELVATNSPSGEHAWIEVEFSSGRTITLRVDEFDLHVNRPRLYVALNDEAETGKDMIL